MIQNTSQSMAVANQKLTDGAGPADVTSMDSADSTTLTGTNNDQYEQERRSHRVCITGHRPQKLSRPEDDIKIDLENTILELINDGYTTFIVGMCYGVDIWAGEIIVRLRNEQKRYGQYTLTQVFQKSRPAPTVSYHTSATADATVSCHPNAVAIATGSCLATLPADAKNPDITRPAKPTQKSIKLIAAVPFEGINEKWIIDSHGWKARYDRLLGDADLVKYISPEYAADAY